MDLKTIEQKIERIKDSKPISTYSLYFLPN